MSGTRDDLNLIEIELGRHEIPSQDSAPSKLAHQFETMANACRGLEHALLRERVYSKQLREYSQTLIQRMHELQKKATDQAEKLRDVEKTSEQTVEKLSSISAEFAQVKTELDRYRRAWTEVLSREQKARAALQDRDGLLRRIKDLENAIGDIGSRLETEMNARATAEDHVNKHRQELQSTLVRIHTSEARYNEMARELESLHGLRKNQVLEVSRLEENARIELEDSVSRAREQVRIEMERFHQNRMQALKAETESRSVAQLASQAASAAQEKRKTAEVHQAEISQREMMIANLSENMKIRSADLTQSRRETTAMEDRAREAETALLAARAEIKRLNELLDEKTKLETRIQVLKDECKLAQDVIHSERRKLKQLADRLLESCDGDVALDRSWVISLRNAAETVTVMADTENRFDSVGHGPKLVC